MEGGFSTERHSYFSVVSKLQTLPNYMSFKIQVDAATGRSYTFFDLLRMCRNVASALVRLGAKKGDVLGNGITAKPMFNSSLLTM